MKNKVINNKNKLSGPKDLTFDERMIIGKAVAEYWDIHAQGPEEDICISAMKKLGFRHITNEEDYEPTLQECAEEGESRETFLEKVR